MPSTLLNITPMVFINPFPKTTLLFAESSGQRRRRNRRGIRCGARDERAQRKRNNDEATKLYSVAGLLSSEVALVNTRPFRSPHHTVSTAALVGGGAVPKPGEVSLSHHGVLFLDELPEFNRDALEVLRQPLEDGVVNVSRVSASYTYPADFTLVAAMNPCPCGYFGDVYRQCNCTHTQVQKYQKRISGPLLDRIDLHIEVPRLSEEELLQSRTGESSTAIRERVCAAQSTTTYRSNVT
jgi:magnesium chelatase family protein